MKEFLFSDESFTYFKELALERIGMVIKSNKKETVYNRFVKRLRSLNLHSFDEYCLLLQANEQEVSIFINLLTNIHTSFFRENHHFNYLGQIYFPSIISSKTKIRIWVSSCSTGEEAYSTAIVAYEAIPAIENFDIKILATDVNTEALQTAEKGIYERKKIQRMSIDRQEKWFIPIKNTDSVKINPKLKNLVYFHQLNLIKPWPMRGLFDVIFCRNTLIYFPSHVARTIMEKFYHQLQPGGFLILGHSEILNIKQYYNRVQTSIYQKLIVDTKYETH